MASAHLGAWCPEFRALGPAELPDHRLAFLRRSIRWQAGVVDILPDPGSSVWGVVYELPVGLGELDAKEAEGVAYRRREVEVLMDGSPLAAMAYQLIEREPMEVAPRREYVDLLVAGAREHRLPADYVAALAGILAS
jgi:gamma-glutamylcyclotransferase